MMKKITSDLDEIIYIFQESPSGILKFILKYLNKVNLYFPDK